MNNVKILYFHRVNVFEETHVNKAKCIKKESDIFHHFYFSYYSFKFKPNACNRCHDLLMISINFSDFAILNIKGSDYCCIINLISKSEVVNLMQKTDLTEKKWSIIKPNTKSS